MISMSQKPTCSSSAPKLRVTSCISFEYVISMSLYIFLASSAAFVNSSCSNNKNSMPRHCFFYLMISTVRMDKKAYLKFSTDGYCLSIPDVHLFSNVNRFSQSFSITWSSSSIISPSLFTIWSEPAGYWKES
jgi:hypothetical protein